MSTLNIKNSKLNLIWTARFRDNTILSQFEGDKENKFKEVQDRFRELYHFSIHHINKPLTIGVDLIRGLIFLNQAQIADNDLIKTKDNIRLIFFRRHKVQLANNFVEKNHSITYFIGYQYTDKTGRNKKVIVQADQEGNIVIGD